MSDHILVIDEGTTSTRAIAFDRDLRQVALAQEEVALAYPADGWVEQDASQIWSSSLSVARRVIEDVGGVGRFAGVGVANQRETTIVWDRETGEPIAPAIIWQDRRTAKTCESLAAAGRSEAVQAETGLLLDPYFSGTKIGWLLDHVDGARERAEAGALAFGTVDSWLIWKLTAGAVHATDVTNASRTLLFPLQTGAFEWSRDMTNLLNVPSSMLPDARPSSTDFGLTDPEVFGAALPILSAIGDQQAALVGHGALASGQAKITYGTGAFLVANTGPVRPDSANRLLGTIGYDIQNGPAAYALEGSIFNAGTVVKWLRDDLGLISDAAESEAKAAGLDNNAGVYMAPAFTGLGAPHWDAEARGLICGLTRAARAEHIVRAGLEAAAYQTRDLLDAFAADGAPVEALKVDGGMAANDWLMQFIADICECVVERPDYSEMTALGAAALAAMQLDWTSAQDCAGRERPGRCFEPAMNTAERNALLAGWKDALERARS